MRVLKKVYPILTATLDSIIISAEMNNNCIFPPVMLRGQENNTTWKLRLIKPNGVLNTFCATRV